MTGRRSVNEIGQSLTPRGLRVGGLHLTFRDSRQNTLPRTLPAQSKNEGSGDATPMMRQMRENTKWIMLVAAIAFVALMVFEWGMDVSGRSAMGVGEIGRVNGTPVLYDDYLAVYRNLYDQTQAAQEEPISTQQNKQIEDQAFEDVVTSILVRQELERRGIVVTDDEIREAARFSPPPGLAQSPAFVVDGQFNFQRYQDFLATQADDALLLQLEAYYRDLIPRSKLIRQLSAGSYLSDNLLWQQWRDQSEQVQIRYVALNPAQRIADADVQVTDAQISAYYRANEDDFAQPARASVIAAVIGKAPTPADTLAVEQLAEDLRVRLSDGETFDDLAPQYSADQGSAAQGGDLGVFARGMMVAAFDSAVFAAPVGRVAAPVRTNFGWHVLQVDERWGQDSARARHILLPFERTDESEIALLTRADSLETLGEAMTLTEAAAALGLEVATVEINEDFALVSGAGQIIEGADWVFSGEASAGDVSPVFENAQAFYALELVESSPARVLSLDEARETIRQVLLIEGKTRLAVEQAQPLVERTRGGEPLPNVAADAGLDIRLAGPFTRDEFVPGIGRFNAAVGTAFGLEVGQISDVIEAAGNAFIIELIERIPADSTAWLEQVDVQRNQVASVLQQQRLEEWLEGLRENARVVDRREEVLQPVDESQPLGLGGPFGF
jgi:peptidyl-prolyl cis-trans isomerase D